MVVLSASIISKQGKPILARQYVEMPRLRVEGLLAAFPKLIGSSKKQHTYIETENVRYVYQPMDQMYLLLVTNRGSNIIEDLDILRLLSKVIKEYAAITEASISDKLFDLVFAFDEAISNAGYNENMTLAQIKINMEMESHDEKLHNMIRASKEIEALENSKRKAAAISKTQKEMARMERAGLGGGGPNAMGGISSSDYNHSRSMGDSNMGGGGGGGYNNAPAPTYTKAPEPAYVPKPMGGGMSLGGGGGGGMNLGGGRKDLEAMASEDGIVIRTPVRAPVQNNNSGNVVTAPQVVARTPSAPVEVVIEEKLSVQISRSGELESLKINGSLNVLVNEDTASKCRIKVVQGQNSNFQFQMNPNIDKNLLSAENLVGFKKTDKDFTVGAAFGCIRWRNSDTKDQGDVPLNIVCWPETNSTGGFTVNVEYTLERTDMTLENVIIVIPLGTTEIPKMKSCDGVYRHNPKINALEWKFDVISGDNSNGSMEFDVRSPNEDCFFPIDVNFTSRDTYCKIHVENVIQAADGSSIKFTAQSVLATAPYVIC